MDPLHWHKYKGFSRERTWERWILRVPTFETINFTGDPLIKFKHFYNKIAHRFCEFAEFIYAMNLGD